MRTLLHATVSYVAREYWHCKTKVEFQFPAVYGGAAHVTAVESCRLRLITECTAIHLLSACRGVSRPSDTPTMQQSRHPRHRTITRLVTVTQPDCFFRYLTAYLLVPVLR